MMSFINILSGSLILRHALCRSVYAGQSRRLRQVRSYVHIGQFIVRKTRGFQQQHRKWSKTMRLSSSTYTACLEKYGGTNRAQGVQWAGQHDSWWVGEVAEGRAIRDLRLVQGRWIGWDNWAREVRPLAIVPSDQQRLTVDASGRKIIDILKKNPKKAPSKYDEEDIGHMRKVVSYNKRHLAQEEKVKQNTNSKSYKSLKNWGHDAQKT